MSRALPPGGVLSRTSGPAAVCNAIGYAEDEDGSLRALLCRTGQLAVSLGSDPQALDASHVVTGILAPDVRSHAYARNTAGTWYGVHTEPGTSTYANRAFPEGTLSVAAQLYAADGGSTRYPLLMNTSFGGLNVAPYATRPDGNGAGIVSNTAGRLYMVPGLPHVSDTSEPNPVAGVYAAAALSHVAKASPAWLLGIDLTSESAAGYLQAHNTITTPAALRVPEFCWPIPAGSTTPHEFVRSRGQLAEGLKFNTGLTFVWSSTRGTYTAAAFTGTLATYTSP